MAHIDILPMGSTNSRDEQISHFSGSQGASLPGAARKDKVDSGIFFREANRRGRTEAERSTSVTKYSIWPLINKRKNQSNDSNPYSIDLLQEKVNAGIIEQGLVDFYQKIYNCINDRPDFFTYRQFVESDIDGFFKKYADEIYRKYRTEIDIYRFRDAKGRFTTPEKDVGWMQAIQKWTLDTGYIKLAEDNFQKKVTKLRDELLSCSTIEEAKKKFDGVDGSFFTNNEVFDLANKDSGIRISQSWQQIVNIYVYSAFADSLAKVKIKNDSLYEKAIKKYVPVKNEQGRAILPSVKSGAGIILSDSKDLQKSYSKTELKELKKAGLFVEMPYKFVLEFANSCPDTFAVVDTEYHKFTGINLCSKGEAEKLSVLMQKAMNAEPEQFREKFFLKELKRVGPVYRTDGSDDGRTLVRPDVFDKTGNLYEEGDLTREIGFRGIEWGNEMPGKRANPHSEIQEHSNWVYDSFRDLGNVLGVDPKSITENMYYAVGSRGKKYALAQCELYFDADSKKRTSVLHLSRFKGMGSLGHEWIHALDHNLCDKVLGSTNFYIVDKQKVNGKDNIVSLNGDMLSNSYQLIDQEKFPKLYKLMETINSDTEFSRTARKLDEETSSKYFSSPEELLARAGACYLVDKFKNEGMNISGEEWVNDYLNGNAERYVANFTNLVPLFPCGEDRKMFYNLFDDAFTEIKELGLLKTIDSPDFSSLTCKRDGKERYITGNIEHVTLPLIGKDNEPDVKEVDYSSIANDIENAVVTPIISNDSFVSVKVSEPAVIDRVYSDVIAIKNIRHSFNAKGKIKGQAKEITKLVQEKIPTIDFDKFNITEIGNKSREHLFGER